MARLVDVIEEMIKEMIDENDGRATISRSVLAERANCVPSQITYVLSTRFSTGNGYIVESRRGGGGQITVMRAPRMNASNYISFMIDSVGGGITQQQARILISNAVSCGAVTRREGACLLAALSDRALGKIDSDVRALVRADIFKNALLSLMME